MVYRIGNREVDLAGRTRVMGILNVTPDSFSDGGRFLTQEAAVARGLAMVEEGADVLDIGGESTRPRGKVYGQGAARIPVQEELDRVIPVIEALCRRTDVPVSVDTWKSQVASEALKAGASIVNDISGFHFDPALPGVVAAAGATAVLMHTPAPPWDMPEHVAYDDLIGDILQYLHEGVEKGKQAGVTQFFLDPGFGFGKTYEQNITLLRTLGDFVRRSAYPVLAGMSRKSFLGKALNLAVEDRFEGSIAAASLAAFQGVRVVRVHDVRGTVRALALTDAITHLGLSESLVASKQRDESKTAPSEGRLALETLRRSKPLS